MAMTRTFIAIPMAKTVEQALAKLLDPWRERYGDVKWVGDEHWHLTLIFLGDLDDARLAATCRIAQGVATLHPPFDLALEGAGAFPTIDRARVFWIGVADGAQETVSLQRDLSEELIEVGYRPEPRPFTPHLTIGRVRATGRRGPGRSSDGAGRSELVREIRAMSHWRAPTFRVEQFHVVGSELTQKGPVYTVLAREKLGSA